MAELKAVVRKADQLPAPMVALVQTLIPDCTALLPPDISTEQFRAALWLELTGRPDLADSPLDDLRLCIVKAAQYGLLPGRDCHFLPFRQKQKGGRKCATYVPNYQGILRSLYRTGQIDQAFAEVVYAHDVFDLDLGRPQVLIHKPARTQRGDAEGAYGFILVKGSTRPLVHYMDWADIDRVRRKSPAHEAGPWVSDPQEMWRKTAMKNSAKYAPLPPQMQGLLAEDDARLLADIPPDRHQANLAYLFDNGASASTPTSGTGDGVGTGDGGPPAGGEEGTAWRRTVAAHGTDPRLPAALRERCGLVTAETLDAVGFELAGQVLDWLEADGG